MYTNNLTRWGGCGGIGRACARVLIHGHQLLVAGATRNRDRHRRVGICALAGERRGYRRTCNRDVSHGCPTTGGDFGPNG